MAFKLHQQLKSEFQRSYTVIMMQAEGLSHQDSLLQPPFRGNCFNWVLGHILALRNDILAGLEQERFWSPQTYERYQTNSDPISNNLHALPLEKLLDDLEKSQEALIRVLEDDLLEETLEKQIQRGDRTMKLGDRISFLSWHESYHVGQLELLRQLAGKNDKII